MSVSIDDVRHIAALARLGIDDDRARAFAEELNSILVHMERLGRVDTRGVDDPAVDGVAGLPLRADEGPPAPLARAIGEFAPRTRDGFFLVPRLSTHEDPEASS
jgi:aspartyl-tRNA(Asn)/glutamyl-tRNA(Gln) amidotransferase subunit C